MKKEIYFYWGNETMSFMRYMTLYSFRKLNPDWTITLLVNKQTQDRRLRGTIEKQDKTEYKGKDYSYLLSKLGIDITTFRNSMIDLDENIVRDMSDVHIKDILNWKLLAGPGGIVSDMDILFLKPIGNLIDASTDIGLVCFAGHPKKDYIPVSFMYSGGDNVFFLRVYENALKEYKPNVYESCGTLCIKEKNLEEVKENFSNLNIQRLLDPIVFPFIDYEWGKGVEMLYGGDFRNAMRKDSIGLHWYGGAPLSQYFNNIINESTINRINNTITICMREIF
jgi:hypothetical protein